MKPYKSDDTTSLVEGKLFEYDFENQDLLRFRMDTPIMVLITGISP